MRVSGCVEFKASKRGQLALPSGASESGRDGRVRVMDGSGHRGTNLPESGDGGEKTLGETAFGRRRVLCILPPGRLLCFQPLLSILTGTASRQPP